MVDFDFRPVIILIAILSAVIGWGVIEGIIWLIRHVHIAIK